MYVAFFASKHLKLYKYWVSTHNILVHSINTESGLEIQKYKLAHLTADFFKQNLDSYRSPDPSKRYMKQLSRV